MRFVWGFSVLLSTLLLGCGPAVVVEAAYHGDLSELRREIKKAERAGQLSRHRVLELARAVARREVRSARGGVAVERIRAARGCARSVSAELRERASLLDEAGAEATLVLLEAGLVDGAALVTRYGSADSGAWRAVAARAAVLDRYAPLRRRLLSDPDERVRRAALRAAADAKSTEDLADLLEGARLDPDPLSRSMAILTAGHIGGEQTVFALRDLWPRANQQDRLGIVEAWSRPAAFGTSGRAQLLRVVETEVSLSAIAAAAALVRAGDETAKAGREALIRAISSGTADERRLAIQLVLLDGDVAGALRTAAKEAEPQVQVLALARLLEIPGQRDAAAKHLRIIAAGGGSTARQARAALAAVGDGAVVPFLNRDLQAAEPMYRRYAAIGLVRLERYAAAAHALADSDGSVRMAVACNLAASERAARR